MGSTHWFTSDSPLVLTASGYCIAMADCANLKCRSEGQELDMSIRIYTDGLASAAASEASRSEELSRANGPGKQPVAGSSGEGGDQVQISSLSESIAAGSSQQGVTQANRVRQIAAQYQNGTYQVDSLQLSRALVSNAIRSGAVENG